MTFLGVVGLINLPPRVVSNGIMGLHYQAMSSSQTFQLVIITVRMQAGVDSGSEDGLRRSVIETGENRP